MQLKSLKARREGASRTGLIISEMIKYLEGKGPELQASRQVRLLDFIASVLLDSRTSKPEACLVTLHLLKLLKIVLSAPVNRSHFIALNLLPLIELHLPLNVDTVSMLKLDTNMLHFHIRITQMMDL